MSNKLSLSHSPYLLQHKDNPVEWHEWSDETFALAKAKDLPIFLSIGYSTCHWCHVMAHESFEDQETARLMNETFINIKVDREERPDIDAVYMEVCQAMTGHGGWPLTILMTADKKPFYSATYIPKTDRGERVGMQRLCQHVKGSWTNERDKLLKAANEITTYISQQKLTATDGTISEDHFKAAVNHFKQRFDTVWGGFGDRPKFPSPHNLLFLLRDSAFTGDETCQFLAIKTLDQMRLGGFWDHIGFGFHRYSTDKQWLLPHFEKMLYDQALLLYAYSEAYHRLKSPRYKHVAEDIYTYLTDKLLAAEGAFYSAEDADSEGVEGKFYVWSLDEINKQLSAEDAQFFANNFQLSNEGNFEEEHNGQKNGQNIPHLKSFLSPSESTQFARIQKTLYANRETRIHPSLDNKILTDWNGLVIAALAKSAAVLNNQSMLKTAKEAFQFLLSSLSKKNGTLLKRYCNGHAGLPAHLNDYAATLWAALELYLAMQDSQYLEHALRLEKSCFSEFWDDENGGYFLTAHSGEALIYRPKEIYDGAMPSGNSMMAFNLNLLFSITGNLEFQEKSQKLNALFASYLDQHAAGASFYLLAQLATIRGSQEIIVITDSEDPETDAKLQLLNETYHPTRLVLVNPQASLVPYAANHVALEGKTTIYICENFACQQPIKTLAELQKAL
jgi:hypothetical protein